MGDPIESLAEGLLLGVRDSMDSMFFPTSALAGMVDDYDADGIVFHPIKSCRTVSTGLADNRRALMERRDVPSLFIESDMMDRRVVSEAQLKNRIDAFFESIDSRRQIASALQA
jgi:benzoyl-CoA reductase subunit B